MPTIEQYAPTYSESVTSGDLGDFEVTISLSRQYNEWYTWSADVRRYQSHERLKGECTLPSRALALIAAVEQVSLCGWKHGPLSMDVDARLISWCKHMISLHSA